MRVTTVMAVMALGLYGCGSTGGDDGGTGGGSSGTGGGSSGTGGGSSGTGGGSSGTGGGTAVGTGYVSGSLWAGNPQNDDPMARPPDGAGLLEDPPFHFRTIVFSNGQMITHNGREIWRASLSDSKLHKITGKESSDRALISGSCANALFSNIFSIALGSDGSLYVSDQTANAILKVSDPLGAGCSVSILAGAAADIPEGIITPNSPPNVGNVDGIGSAARFGLPERLTIDSNNNLYVWDNGNNSIRKIANDASHTVSTLTTVIGGPGGGAVMSETFLNGKVYVWGKNGNDVFLAALDASTGARTNLFTGRADLFGGDSSDSQVIGGIVNDGARLILFFNGQLWAVDPTSGARSLLAGVYKPGFEFASGYDPKVSHQSATLQLPTSPGQIATAGVESYLAIDSAKNLYVEGTVLNTYVEKITYAP